MKTVTHENNYVEFTLRRYANPNNREKLIVLQFTAWWLSQPNRSVTFKTALAELTRIHSLSYEFSRAEIFVVDEPYVFRLSGLEISTNRVGLKGGHALPFVEIKQTMSYYVVNKTTETYRGETYTRVPTDIEVLPVGGRKFLARVLVVCALENDNNFSEQSFVGVLHTGQSMKMLESNARENYLGRYAKVETFKHYIGDNI